MFSKGFIGTIIVSILAYQYGGDVFKYSVNAVVNSESMKCHFEVYIKIDSIVTFLKFNQIVEYNMIINQIENIKYKINENRTSPNTIIFEDFNNYYINITGIKFTDFSAISIGEVFRLYERLINIKTDLENKYDVTHNITVEVDNTTTSHFENIDISNLTSTNFENITENDLKYIINKYSGFYLKDVPYGKLLYTTLGVDDFVLSIDKNFNMNAEQYINAYRQSIINRCHMAGL